MMIRFGEFLIENNVITEEQLKRALSQQTTGHYKFGESAFELGIIERKHIDTVLAAMTEEAYAGKNFGTVAKELGLLSPDEVDEVTALQDDIAIRLGEILAMSGYISKEEAERRLAEFMEKG
jgi:hypothetical protein